MMRAPRPRRRPPLGCRCARVAAIVLGLALACSRPVPDGAAGTGDGDGGAPRPTTPLAVARDLGWALQGYTPTWLTARDQAADAAARRHAVSRDLPAVEFGALRRVVLGPDGAAVVAEDIRALEGRRVRIEGRALPLDELADAPRFVLHDAPFVRCVHVATPATNRQVLVELAEGVTFDFTDAPLMVEGVLRVGRFETFAEGDVALYALEDARVEVLPLRREDMVIGTEHGAAAHDGEVHIPARRGAIRMYDPGGQGHEH